MCELLVADKWQDFEVLDAGNYMKLERWGWYVIARPEPRALWCKQDPKLWNQAHAAYEKDGWVFSQPPPEPWKITYRLANCQGVRAEMVFKLRPTDFKHTGVFPEQAVNWEWISGKIADAKRQSPRVLNLFAYTGGSTMAAAVAGARVTHVDASKAAVTWASENAKAAGIPDDRIRWIQDDAMRFVKREQRRGQRYDAIIMDPPRFGRGSSGEVWKLEKNLPDLMFEAGKLLSPTPLFWLLNAYTASLSHEAIRYVLEDAVKGSNLMVESGELGLPVRASGRVLPAGVCARAFSQIEV